MAFTYNENDTGRPTVKPGTYEVYATRYTIGTTKNTGHNMITMDYKIREDVQQESQGSEIRFDNFVESDKSQWRMNLYIKLTGIAQSGKAMEMAQWAEAELGRPIKITVAEREYNGRKNLTVRKIAATDFPKMTKAPAIESHAKFNSAAQKAQQGMATASQQTAQQYQQQSAAQPQQNDPFANNGQSIDISDDSLPF